MRPLPLFCVLVASFEMLAAGPADDAVKLPDPWLGVSVVAKRADVRAKDDHGNVVKGPLPAVCNVAKVDGYRLALRFPAPRSLEEQPDGYRLALRFPAPRSLEEQPIAWVAKDDVVRRDGAEAYFSEQIRTKPTAFAFRSRAMVRGTYNNGPAIPANVRDDSLSDLNEAIRLDPTDGLAFQYRSTRWLLKNDYDRALADNAEALRLLAGDDVWRDRVRQMRAYLYLRKGDEAQFFAEYEKILLDLDEDDPDRRSETIRQRAFVLSMQGKTDRALVDYGEALKITGVSLKAKVATLTTRASLHVRMEKVDLALADLDEAIRLCPADARWKAYPLRQRAAILANMKKETDRALADVDEAIRVDPTDTSAQTNRGDLLKAKGDIPGAIAAYSRVLSELPSASVYQKRAQAYAEMKDYDRAIADYDGLVHLSPNWPNVHLLRGEARFNKGDYDGASADFDEAIKRKPTSAGAFLYRGRAFHAKGDYDRAIANYSEAIRFDPNDKWGHFNRASARYSAGDPGTAVADYTEAIRLDPQFAKAHAWRGRAYQDINRPADAIADFERALEFEPKEEGWVRPHLGDLKLAAKEYDAAISLYTEHLKHVEPYAHIFVCRARARGLKGDHEEALADCDRALEIEPDFDAALYERGNLLRKLGRFDKSLEDLEKLIELLPESPQGHLSRASTLRKLGRREEALAACEKAIQLDPKRSNAYLFRGDSKFDRGLWADALADYDEAIRLEPTNALPHAAKAVALATAYDPKFRDGARAVESANRAIELGGGKDPACLWSLAVAQAEKGDFDAALRAVKSLEDITKVTKPDDPFGAEVPHLRALFRAKTSYRGRTGRVPAIEPGVVD